VVSVGAATNVASAILLAPEILERIVVVWLGGNPSYRHGAVEFNVEEDLHASHVLLDSGVALVHIPCRNVTEHLPTTQSEVDRSVRGRGEIGEYLAGIYDNHLPDHFGRSKSCGMSARSPAWSTGSPTPWALLPAQTTRLWLDGVAAAGRMGTRVRLGPALLGATGCPRRKAASTLHASASTPSRRRAQRGAQRRQPGRPRQAWQQAAPCRRQTVDGPRRLLRGD
jgi:hypothetical protein